MATTSAIARPYAQAAFEYAQAQSDLPGWEAMLKSSAEAIAQPELAAIVSNTRVTSEQWFDLLSSILGPVLNDSRQNFLRLLTDNSRLAALPEIAKLFKEYEALNNKTAEAQVYTAVPMNEAQQTKLAQKLEKLFNNHITLNCQIDESILGGAVVRVGDKVIDGSVRGELTRLLDFAIR
jgi:F-type H+-transporting ATPase subunit delta